MERECPSCGELLPARPVRFCPACGQPAAPARSPRDSPGYPGGEPEYPGSEPAWRPESQPPGKRRIVGQGGRGRVIALMVVVVLVFGAAGAFAGRHRTAGPPAAPPGHQATTASQGSSRQAELSQLKLIAAAVRQSAAARAEVIKATTDVGRCRMKAATGISLLRRAIRIRQQAAASAARLPVTAIPGGPAMVRDLVGVLRDSISADRGFSGWMRDIQAGGSCHLATASNGPYQAGLLSSTQANRQKKLFLKLWNPLADRFGQPQFTPVDI